MAYDFTRPTRGYKYTCIKTEEPKPGVKLITLNRPESLNAISTAEAEDMENIFQELKFDNKTRVVILTGAGRGFCAGTDLKEMAEFTVADDRLRNQWYLQKHMENIIELMRTCPQPIIAAVNGAACGGGASFVMASDIRIAVPKVKFVLAYINVGMSGADMGSSYMLPRLIGVSRAAELMYTGRTVDGVEGERLGIFNRCVEPDKLMDTAMEYADVLLQKSELGLIQTKEAINAAMDGASMFTQMNFENRNQFVCTAMGSFAEGSGSFAKKHS
jgi:enoyl-CoA hydratase/carnithine racemase